ncbi:MAG: cytosine permease [Firmicutes bacterium]|nr:cytosine permease [Bacillota bacterium]
MNNSNNLNNKSWMEKINQSVGDYELSHIPPAARHGFLTVLFVWVGFNINISEIASGALIYSGLGLTKGIIAVLIGCLMLGIVGALVGAPCQKLGITYGGFTHYIWGSKGSIYASVMISLGEATWISFLTSMCGTLFNVMFGWPIIPCTIISGLVFMTTAFVGFRALARLSYFAVFAVFFGLIASAIFALGDKTNIIAQFMPGEQQSVWWGITMVYGTWAVGITHTGDIVRFARKPFHASIMTILVFMCSEMILMTIGGLFAIATGESEIISAFSTAGLVLTGAFVIFLATWTTADNCLYSSALPLSSASQAIGHPIPKWKIVLVLGFLFNVLIAALGLYSFYENFLGILTIFWVGFAGIAISDYWLVHKGKGKYKMTIDEVDKKTKSINIPAFIAYGFSCLVAYLIDYVPHPDLPFILNSSAFDALVVGILSYWLICVVFTKDKQTGGIENVNA